ncbi:TIGR00341 family protein [Rhodohalobacter barkolensis]|uniref:TIGR00341 family protein n=1 Tax=Rhodohalobacter barkolensis TaxID=2053187 RepID=A0A2N0VLA0_9BACT|nr:TIGR00341 family protein [Rhodohalobacter barkolensis]PKD44929.1 TIGR00341 family protein [Rhodohalobacter barkolensis]
MALRLIQIITPEDCELDEDIIDEDDVIEQWVDDSVSGRTTIHILADVELTEKILADIDDRLGHRDDYRVILLPVAATIPKQETNEEKEDEPPTQKEKEQGDKRVKRISRDELYEEIKAVVDISWVYFVLIALSCVVAANGLIRDSGAMVIGAMVIAPILGPNVGLSLATTLGDKALMIRSMKSIVYGFSLGMVLSIMMGFMIQVDPEVYEISSRTSVSFADIALGLSAGVAGCLSFTRGISAAVIGVMVAVALLPPMVATGLLLGSGMYDLAFGAAILTITYIICVNLAGVVTFLLQGIKPKSFRERREGEELSRYAIMIWVSLLIGLAAIIYFQFM